MVSTQEFKIIIIIILKVKVIINEEKNKYKRNRAKKDYVNKNQYLIIAFKRV